MKPDKSRISYISHFIPSVYIKHVENIYERNISMATFPQDQYFSQLSDLGQVT